ncbi:MAG: metal-dependent hydrolase, partial [Candidatus Thorarchaeota archaeon]
MDIITHLVFGALMYILFFKGVTFDYLIYAMFFAILPDLDVFLFPLKRFFKSNYLEHRSGSHSYVIGIIISAIIGIIISTITNQSFFDLWIIGSIFYGIHISQDLLTTTKIPCFYPLSKKEYSFYVEKAGSGFTLISSVILIMTLIISYNIAADISFILSIINIYTYYMLIYYIYRIIAKIWINHRLNEHQKYLPGVLPFNYFIFDISIENNKLMTRIEKKSHISGSKIIYENKTNLTPRDMYIYKKGLELCMENYYFGKWTVLPELFKYNGVTSLKFFFLEPMIKARATYLKFEFDNNTEQ